MRNILSSLASLMGASFFVNGSNAAITTMIALIIAENGGSQSEVATISACYFIGFFVGCFLLTNQIFRVGLIRAYAAASAVLTITIIVLDLIYGVWLWAFLRFTMGATMAAVLAIADTWINNKTPNDRRGSVLAIYATVMGAAALFSQMTFLVFDANAEGFVLMFAIATNLAVVLVAMTIGTAPVIEREPRKFQLTLVVTSRTAVVCAFSAGFMTAAYVTVVPFYQSTQGVDENMIAALIIALFLGRLLFMWPVGYLSDRLDRRTVLMILTGIAAIITVLMWFIFAAPEENFIRGDAGTFMQILALLAVMLLGGVLYPVFSVASSLAFDRAGDRQMIDVSTTILAVNSLGSISGPLAVSIFAVIFGKASLAVLMTVAASASFMVALLRRPLVASSEQHTPSVAPVPESSVGMAQAAAEAVEAEIEKAEVEKTNG